MRSETLPGTLLVLSVKPRPATFPSHHSGLEKAAEGYLGLAEKWFVFSMVWSVMAAADEAGRVKLDAFLRDVEVLIGRDHILSY